MHNYEVMVQQLNELHRKANATLHQPMVFYNPNQLGFGCSGATVTAQGDSQVQHEAPSQSTNSRPPKDSPVVQVSQSNFVGAKEEFVDNLRLVSRC